MLTATIYSDGFAETGEEGRRMQEEVMAIARAGGVRVLGPNCIGILSIRPSFALSVNAVLEMDHIKPGPFAIVSQSGSMTGGLLSRGLGRGAGFSKLISVGNEADIGVGELADMLVDDPHTGAILLFLETLRDADRLAYAARRAYAANKPVIVYKLGRSDIGQDLAASHTGALAGADEVADAYFRAHGMLRVEMLETSVRAAGVDRGTETGQAPSGRRDDHDRRRRGGSRRSPRHVRRGSRAAVRSRGRQSRAEKNHAFRARASPI